MHKNNKKNKNNKDMTEIIYGKNTCFGCIEGYKNGIRNRSIYAIYILQNKFDEFYKKIPNDLRHLVQKVNNHDMFVYTHEQDKHQGIALKVSKFQFLNIDELIDKCAIIYEKQKHCSLFLLDEVQDPHNVGNIIRSAFCFNVNGIILTEKNSCDITPAVVRTSVGYSEQSLICKAGNLAFSIEKLKKNGFLIIGFDVNTNTKDDLTKVVQNNKKCVFIFGSEGFGMRELTKKNCDLIIKLPMRKEAESLNVATTTAVVGWEITKNLENNK